MRAKYFSKDIGEFIVLLYKYNVKYIIVGGEAVIYYGYPRLTGVDDFVIGDLREPQICRMVTDRSFDEVWGERKKYN